MFETTNAHLPASWLTTRLGADAAELDYLRREGELFAVRPDGADEWHFSAWQFGPGGTVPRAVRAAVRAARTAGVSESSLLEILRRRVGLAGGTRLYDLLFEGNGDRVVAEVQAARG